MQTQENTIVIVKTKHAWLTIFEGEIIDEHQGSPLMSYQSRYPKYSIVQLTQATLRSKAIKLVSDYFEEQQDEKKVVIPEEKVETRKTKPVSLTRAQKRKAKKEAKLIAKNEATKAKQQVKQEEPEVHIPEIIAPPLLLTEHKSKTSKIMKNLNQNTETAVAKSRIGIATGINFLTDVACLIGYGTTDLVNWGGSSLVKAVGDYDESVAEMMDKRREMVSNCEDAILNSPTFIKDYASESFSKLQADRDARLAKLRRA